MDAVRVPTPAEREAYEEALLVAGEVMPYYLHALFRLVPLAAPGLGTFAVDEHWRLYMDPVLLVGEGAWPPALRGAVLLHEVSHLLRDHAARAADIAPQPVSPVLWNYAADAEINQDLLAAGIALPDGAITPADPFGCPTGWLAEQYYHAIRERGDQFDLGDEPPCGSGAGCPAHDWEGAPVDGAEGLDPVTADIVRRQVADAVMAANTRGRGSAPAGMVRWAGQVLAPPQVPWNRQLRSGLRRAIANKAGHVYPTYSRPARRRIPGVLLPAMRQPVVRVCEVVDTSGSMSTHDLQTAVAEVTGVLESSCVDRDNVQVLACDAASTAPARVRSAADIELVGGGGTDMRVGIAAAEAARPAPDVIVVLTDGDTPWPTERTRAHLICVIIGNPRAAAPPAWATTVHVPSTRPRTPTPARR
ncbi:vWA domain-containing protein [Nocardia sp. IFM 10818]